MQLSHAWDDGFFALWVIVYSERGILSGKTVKSFGKFVQVILVEQKKGLEETKGCT